MKSVIPKRAISSHTRADIAEDRSHQTALTSPTLLLATVCQMCPDEARINTPQLLFHIQSAVNVCAAPLGGRGVASEGGASITPPRNAAPMEDIHFSNIEMIQLILHLIHELNHEMQTLPVLILKYPHKDANVLKSWIWKRNR